MDGNATPATNTFALEIGATSTPATIVGISSNATINLYQTQMAILPNNWYYKVVNAGTNVIAAWTEQVL